MNHEKCFFFFTRAPRCASSYSNTLNFSEGNLYTRAQGYLYHAIKGCFVMECIRILSKIMNERQRFFRFTLFYPGGKLYGFINVSA